MAQSRHARRAFHRSSRYLLPVRVHAPVLALNSEPSSFLYLHDIHTATASLIQKTDTTMTLETINLVVSMRTQSHQLFFSVLVPTYKLVWIDA